LETASLVYWSEILAANPGPLSLITILEELLGRKSSGSRLEN
jgi:hypothetical protein